MYKKFNDLGEKIELEKVCSVKELVETKINSYERTRMCFITKDGRVSVIGYCENGEILITTLPDSILNKDMIEEAYLSRSDNTIYIPREE